MRRLGASAAAHRSTLGLALEARQDGGVGVTMRCGAKIGAAYLECLVLPAHKCGVQRVKRDAMALVQPQQPVSQRVAELRDRQHSSDCAAIHQPTEPMPAAVAHRMQLSIPLPAACARRDRVTSCAPASGPPHTRQRVRCIGRVRALMVGAMLCPASDAAVVRCMQGRACPCRASTGS